jgi:hypothetical protein
MIRRSRFGMTVGSCKAPDAYMTSAVVDKGRGIGLGVHFARISVNRLSRLTAAADTAGRN